MIDIENTVFNTVASALRTAYPGIKVYGEYVPEDASFPCVCLWESENSIVAEREDTSDLDNYVNVSYSVQVFTNTPTKKLDGKEIAKFIDDIMVGLRFRRSLMSQVPNVDRTIYRYELRYTGIVKRTDFQATESGDTLYQIYTR